MDKIVIPGKNPYTDIKTSAEQTAETRAENLSEQVRLDTFRRVQAYYYAGSTFHKTFKKVLDTVRGTTPDWDVISQYGKPALTYLDRVAYGETFWQKKQIKDNQKKGKFLTDEEIKEKNYNHFIEALNQSESWLTRRAENDNQNRKVDQDLGNIRPMGGRRSR